MTGCVPKYTCKEAIIHCSECRTEQVTIPIPISVVDNVLPAECLFLFHPQELVFITKKNPMADAVEMFSEYRRLTDEGVLRNTRIDGCRNALESQRKSNEERKENYCINKKLKYDKKTDFCTP